MHFTQKKKRHSKPNGWDFGKRWRRRNLLMDTRGVPKESNQVDFLLGKPSRKMCVRKKRRNHPLILSGQQNFLAGHIGMRNAYFIWMSNDFWTRNFSKREKKKIAAGVYLKMHKSLLSVFFGIETHKLFAQWNLGVEFHVGKCHLKRPSDGFFYLVYFSSFFLLEPFLFTWTSRASSKTK